MIGLGTIINTIGIIAGGLLGFVFKKSLKEGYQASLTAACGISVLFIGIAGAMEGMLGIEGDSISSRRSMTVVICIVLGTVIGELIDIEALFERFGEWLKRKTGNAKDAEFVNAFTTATFTVCIGAMTIVGALQDGMSGDYSTLAIKTVLDAIIIMVMTSTMGKGCIFSAIPVFVCEGLITIFASFLRPIMTELAMSYINIIGSILIFCVGLNLVWGKKIKVANMLPAVLIAIAAAFI